MSEDFAFHRLLDRTLHLLRVGAGRVAVTILLLAAAGTAIDSNLFGLDGGGALNFALSIATIALQCWLTRAALVDAGLEPLGGSRVGAFVLLSIVSGLGILLGLVLLVVPGVVLLVRWWVAGPILLHSDATVTESLRGSWRAAGGMFWPLLGLLLAIWVPVLFTILVLVFSFGDGPETLLASVVLNLVAYASLVTGWHSAVAAYSFTAAGRSGLAEVFV